MNLPDLDHKLSQTTFGRVTVDIHRAYGETQMVKVRTKTQHKTPTVEESGATIGQALSDILLSQSSGHLEVSITFKGGRLQFTTIEAFLDD